MNLQPLFRRRTTCRVAFAVLLTAWVGGCQPSAPAPPAGRSVARVRPSTPAAGAAESSAAGATSSPVTDVGPSVGADWDPSMWVAFVNLTVPILNPPAEVAAPAAFELCSPKKSQIERVALSPGDRVGFRRNLVGDVVAVVTHGGTNRYIMLPPTEVDFWWTKVGKDERHSAAVVTPAPALAPPPAPVSEPESNPPPPPSGPTAKPDPVDGVKPPPSPGGPASRWAIVVGLSKYQFAGQGGLGNLAFADQDATDFAKALEGQGWGPDHVRLLVNEQATKQALSYALETWLRHAGPGDQVVVFWSGHGWPDPEDPEKAFFACYDSKPSDPSSGMRMDRVRTTVEERRAKNVVFIADTCHSGKVIRANDPKAVGVVPALEAMQKRQDLPKGWVFVASADPDRKAYEDKAWKHGALTQVLLEGMAGKADGYQSAGPKDGVVTMGELRTYMTVRMAEESLTVLGARLLPLFYTTSGDPAIWNVDLRGN